MKKLVLICLTIILAPKMLFAWGHEGHEMVAEMAYQLLDPATQQKVKHYLGSMSIELAATWMDDIKEDHSYDFMKTWHYVNIEKGGAYKASAKPNIINALNNANNELKNKSLPADKVKTNLCILFHLMGDLGQPLHTGYESDRGGGNVEVSVGGRTSNLHSVWDSEIIRNQKISIKEIKAYYNTLKPEAVANIKKGTFVDWMNESRAYLKQVYNFSEGRIDQQYLMQNGAVVKKQIVYEAIRLANILQTLYKS